MLRSVRRDLGRLGIPLLILEAEHDRLSDTPRNHAVIEAALGEKCRFVSFPAEHFLLAEPCRDRVIDSVADWILRVDARRPQHVSSV